MAGWTLWRRAFLSATGAGILAAPAIISGRAFAQTTAQTATDKSMTTQLPPDTHKLQARLIFKVFVIKDGGARPSGKPNETFGNEPSADAVGALLAENFLPKDQFVNSFSPVMIDTGRDVVHVRYRLGQGGRAQGTGRHHGASRPLATSQRM